MNQNGEHHIGKLYQKPNWTKKKQKLEVRRRFEPARKKWKWLSVVRPTPLRSTPQRLHRIEKFISDIRMCTANKPYHALFTWNPCVRHLSLVRLEIDGSLRRLCIYHWLWVGVRYIAHFCTEWHRKPRSIRSIGQVITKSTCLGRHVTRIYISMRALNTEAAVTVGVTRLCGWKAAIMSVLFAYQRGNAMC